MHYVLQSSILLQAGGKANPALQLLPLLGIIAIMVFFVILPQRRQRKKQKEFQESLKKGMSVVTFSGIHGKVVEVGESTVDVEIARNVRVTFDKTAVSMNADAPAEKK